MCRVVCAYIFFFSSSNWLTILHFSFICREAVPTISGKGETVFSEPKKVKQEPFGHQDVCPPPPFLPLFILLHPNTNRILSPSQYCQICYDGGTIHLCQGCPRAYHSHCLLEPYRTIAKSSINKGVTGFWCPQHACMVCNQKTSNAGGMLYRCRWCESAYCEDCLDFDETKLIGEGLVELELLNYGEKPTAYWVKCKDCIHNHVENSEYEEMCDEMEKAWIEQMRVRTEKARMALAKMKANAEVAAEAEAEIGVETPVSGASATVASALSLTGTGVTTTAATSIGSDGEDDDVDRKEVLVTADEDGVRGASGGGGGGRSANSRASSRGSAPQSAPSQKRKTAIHSTYARKPATGRSAAGTKRARGEGEGEGEDEDDGAGAAGEAGSDGRGGSKRAKM